MKPIEEWRYAVGYEELYEVSSLGRVRRSIYAPRRNATKPGRILGGSPEAESGYRRVSLRANGRIYRWQVHRLVAKAFVPGWIYGRQINHKNGIKSDNRAENLEWVTSRENVLHSWKGGFSKPLQGEKNGKHKLTEKEAKACLVLVANGVAQKLLAKAFGVSYGAISGISRGKTWIHLESKNGKS